MTHASGSASQVEPALQGIQEELRELCRVHDVGLGLIEQSHDLEQLLDLVLDEYGARLAELPPAAFDAPGALSPEAQAKLRGLLLFASEAAALKEKAWAATELRQRTEALEAAQARLDSVLAALDAGILILGANGSVERANRAAQAISGRRQDEAGGREAVTLVAAVPRGGDGEVSVAGENGSGRTLLVSRRNLTDGSGGEVVLVHDITARAREIEERHRVEKLAEVLKTLSVLSHKINNPLTALLGRAQILKGSKNADPLVVKAAAVIEESSQRVAELIRELAHVVKEGRQEAVDRLLEIDGARPSSDEV